MFFSNRLSIDTRLLFVLVAVLLAIVIHIIGWDRIIANEAHSLGLLGSFIIGIFYTLGFTTPTAFIMILEMMAMNNALLVAIFAALSAACVDTILFVLLKDQLEKSTGDIIRKIRKKLGAFNALSPFIGFFIFGTPLPDELGLALMEITDIKAMKIFIVVFSAKFITLMLTFYAIKIF